MDEATRNSIESPKRFVSATATTSPVRAAHAEVLPAAALLVDGRFEIAYRLGEGATGIVYKALDRTRRESVALKTLARFNADAIYRFKNEFRVLANVSHPNLVRLHGLFADKGTWFFTMDLVDGIRFDAWVRPDGRLNECRLRSVLPQVISAVGAIHAAGHLHRDLKPSNVLVTVDGRAVVLDFGLVAENSENDAATTTITEDVVCGTPAYMAPEQAAGQGACAASDAYALGVVVFEALTGKLPFDGSPAEILVAKQTKVAPCPRQLNPEAPEDLTTLCAELLSRDPNRRPTLASLTTQLGAGAHASVRVDQPEPETLIGREPELQQLMAAYEATLAENAVVLFVSGESGMGKSALIERFLSELRAQGHAALLAGRCYEQESLPFKGFDSLVDDLSHYLRRLPKAEAAALLPRDAHALARLFPVLDRVDVIAEAPRREIPEPQELRRKAFLAFGELVTRLRDRRPLVMCIDDAQWLDDDSLAFLRTLLIHGQPAPLLAILSHRSEGAEHNRMLQGAREIAHGNTLLEVRELCVGPLRAGAARALAGRWIGPNCDESSARSIADEAGGSPFFVAELARSAARTPHAQISLTTALADHFAALSSESRCLLEIVALAGCPLPMQVAIEGASSTHADLDALRAAHLLRAGGGEALGAVECYHDRIREAVLRRLSHEARTRYYAQLARALKARSQSDAELLARCLEGAGDLALAAVYCERAGDSAFNATAFERAAALYGKALALGQHAPLDRHALSIKLADTFAEAGRGLEAASVYLRCADDATGLAAIDLRRKAAEHFLTCGRTREGETLLREVCAAAGFSPPASIAGAHLSLASTQLRLRFVDLQRRASAQAQSELTRLRLDCMYSAAMSLANHAPIIAAAASDHWLLEALSAGDSAHRARALSMQIYFFTFAFPAHDKRLQQLSIAARQAVADESSPAVNAFVTMGLANAEVNRGHWTAARSGLANTLEVLRTQCKGVAWEIDVCLIYDQIASFERGDFDEIARDAPGVIEDAFRRGRDWVGTLLSSVYGSPARLTHDDVAGARRQLDHAKKRWGQRSEPHWADCFLAMAEALHGLYGRDPEPSHAALEQRTPAFQRSLLSRAAMPRVRYVSIRGGSALAVLRARPGASEARHVAEACASKLRREVLAHGKPHAALLEAGLAIVDGRRERAELLLQHAIQGFDRCDMRTYAAAARRRLGQLQGGEHGRSLVAAGDEALRAAAKNVEAMTEMLCPGCRVD